MKLIRWQVGLGYWTFLLLLQIADWKIRSAFFGSIEHGWISCRVSTTSLRFALPRFQEKIRDVRPTLSRSHHQGNGPWYCWLVQCVHCVISVISPGLCLVLKICHYLRVLLRHLCHLSPIRCTVCLAVRSLIYYKSLRSISVISPNQIYSLFVGPKSHYLWKLEQQCYYLFESHCMHRNWQLNVSCIW